VLRTNPGVIGRTLEGEIETALQAPPEGGVEVRLACVRRVTSGTGKQRKTTERTVWQDHVTVPPEDLARGLAGLRVPVAFAIPSDAPACDDTRIDDQVLWRLTASASVRGIDYGDGFDVPVFDTGAEPLTEAEREALRAPRLAHARAYVPEQPTVRVAHTARGGTRFSGRPRTGIGSAIGSIVMTAGAWIGAWYLWQADIPFAPWFVAFFAVLFTVGTVVSLLLRSSVTLEAGEVVVRHRILGIGPTRRLRPGDIVEVRAEVAGEGRAQSWEVVLKTLDGKSYSAAALIPTQREADWTADRMHSAIKALR
jgi:hypothetical protein